MLDATKFVCILFSVTHGRWKKFLEKFYVHNLILRAKRKLWKWFTRLVFTGIRLDIKSSITKYEEMTSSEVYESSLLFVHELSNRLNLVSLKKLLTQKFLAPRVLWILLLAKTEVYFNFFSSFMGTGNTGKFDFTKLSWSRIPPKSLKHLINPLRNPSHRKIERM